MALVQINGLRSLTAVQMIEAMEPGMTTNHLGPFYSSGETQLGKPLKVDSEAGCVGGVGGMQSSLYVFPSHFSNSFPLLPFSTRAS